MDKILQVVLESIVYGTLGSILMIIGVEIIDLIIPIDFAKEIKKKNITVGVIIAAIYIAIAIIIRSAIIGG